MPRGRNTTVKTIKIISKTLSFLLLSAVILLAVLLGGMRLIGFTPYTVLSGSMEPAYHVGSVIYVREVNPTELKVDDPLTYRMSNGIVVTHRIEEILNDGTSDLSFITKGDANQDNDGTPVPMSAVIGKPVFSIPYLGFVSEFVQRPLGLIIFIGLCLAVLAITFIIDLLLPESGKKSSDSDTVTDSDSPES